MTKAAGNTCGGCCHWYLYYIYRTQGHLDILQGDLQVVPLSFFQKKKVCIQDTFLKSRLKILGGTARAEPFFSEHF